MIINLILLVSSEIPLHPEDGYFHFQSFNDPDWKSNYVVTDLSNVTGKWKVEESKAPQSIPGEKLLFMETSSSFYGISSPFSPSLKLKEKTLVIQYEVRLQETLDCGGAYIKLFGKENYEPKKLCNETKYIIMFGPDKCGSTNKVHFIFRHLNPISGEYEEKHMTDAPQMKVDKLTHLYTLIVRPDNSFEVLIDTESVKQGNLLKDFAPPVTPPKEVDDPDDVKPSDWVDEEMIKDPNAEKPDDWDESQPEYIPDPAKQDPPEGWLVDEPKFITDPDAVKPAEWDDDIHGEWEAPTVSNPKCDDSPGCGEYEPPVVKNPKYKGKWKAPKIKNPAFKGYWKPRQISNPNYYEDENPHNFPDIHGIGFELWMVNQMVGFNNIYVGTDEKAVIEWNEQHFSVKHKTQAAEQKTLEPESKPVVKGEGFGKQLGVFFTQITDSITALYQENAAMTIVLGVVVVLVPISICFLACCKKSSSEVPSRSTGKKAGKKIQKENEEEQPKEVELEEVPEEDQNEEEEEVKEKVKEVVKEKVKVKEEVKEKVKVKEIPPKKPSPQPVKRGGPGRKTNYD